MLGKDGHVNYKHSPEDMPIYLLLFVMIDVYSDDDDIIKGRDDYITGERK